MRKFALYFPNFHPDITQVLIYILMEEFVLNNNNNNWHSLELVKQAGERTYSKSNDSRWKGKEAILSQAFGDSNKEVSDSEEDPPKNTAKDNSTSAQQKEVVPLAKCLDLQPKCLAIPREGRLHCDRGFIKNLLRKAFVEIRGEESEGAIAQALLWVQNRRRGEERGRIGEGGTVVDSRALIDGAAN